MFNEECPNLSPDLSAVALALFEAGRISVHVSGGAKGGLLVAVSLHADGAYQSGVMVDWTAVTQFINTAVYQFVTSFMNDVADESRTAAELVSVTADYFQLRRVAMPVNLQLLVWARAAKEEVDAVEMTAVQPIIHKLEVAVS
jgi:hypothetical protein